MRVHSFPSVYIMIIISLGLAGLMVAFIFISIGYTAGGETFIVNNNGDEVDSTPGNCICATSGGVCTLRAAIQEANACSGAQTITFSGPMVISPNSELPAIIGGYTVIDGSSQWVLSGDVWTPGVVISGFSLSGSENGLVINASHCEVYGIQVVNFPGNGIYISGTAYKNQIGGEGTNQRNVISNNGDNGVRIYSVNATDNVISSNYVGTNSKGLYAAIGNDHHGVSVWYGKDNVITGNLIADNGWSGVAMDNVTNGKISNNRIGMDIKNDSAPNGYYGVHIANGAAPRVSDNRIAFNQRGILVEGGSRAYINGNDIYSNNATSLSNPNGGGVLITGSDSYATLYQNTILDNAALYGGGVAVEDSAEALLDFNTIQENESVRNDTGGLGGGGIYVESATITATSNTIISNTAVGPTGSSYGYPDGGGVYLFDAGDSQIIGNQIRGNHVTGNAGGGGGIMIFRGGNIWIKNNVIYGNNVNTMSTAGSGIDVNTTLGTTKVNIEANRIEENSTIYGGAVATYESDYVTVTNNLIINNHDPGLYLENTGTYIQSNFNTIAMNLGSGIYLKNANLYLYNTLVISNNGYGLEATGGWGLTSTRNDVWGNSLGHSNIGAIFYLNTDPLFYNPGEGEFALHPASPCLDVGDYSHPQTTSYNGVIRPVGAGYDLGAYEMPLPSWLPVIMR